MKTIQVSDEMYEFLINLSKELNTQDHRGTAMPYLFQVQTKKEVIALDGRKVFVCGEDYIYADDEESMINTVASIKGWDLDDDADLAKIDALSDYDLEDILIENDYKEHHVDYETELKNAFLTEKACEEHIRYNAYHYNEPRSYLSYGFRNPELEKVMQFICELTEGGKLHK